MPPAALKRRKRGQLIWLTPANKAANDRSSEIKRPKKTTSRHDAGTEFPELDPALGQSDVGAVAKQEPKTDFSAIQNPRLSPRIAPAEAQATMIQMFSAWVLPARALPQ